MNLNNLYQTPCHQPLLNLKDSSKWIVIGLFRLNHSQEPSAVPSPVPFFMVRNFPFWFFLGTFLWAISWSILKVK